MNRWFVGCAAVALALSSNAQKVSELPAAAKQAVARMEATVIQAKKKAITELTAVMNSETHAGKLDSAVAINAKIKELSAELEGEKAETKKGIELLAGAWHMQNGVLVTIEKNSTFSASGGKFCVVVACVLAVVCWWGRGSLCLSVYCAREPWLFSVR